MKAQIENTEKFYVARDNDGRLFKFEYKNTMKPWEALVNTLTRGLSTVIFISRELIINLRKGKKSIQAFILKLHTKIHRSLLKNKDQNKKNHEYT